MENEIKSLSQEKLIEYLGNLENAMSNGSDFVQEQAPLVVQEIINLYIVEAVIGLLFFIPLVFVAIKSGYYICKNFYNKNYDELKFGTSVLLCFISSFISFMILRFSIYSGVKAIVAPRILIIEYISNLLKSIS